MSKMRRTNSQSLAWFRDLHVRERLQLQPPYQRRSVWNQEYKDYFIDSVLQNCPSPAIFLYEEMTPEGIQSYGVVDGQQRLTAVLEFLDNKFPVGECSTAYRGQFFKDLDFETKQRFWSYQFLVEYLPTVEEAYLRDIFDRLNRNVAKLTPQELRHARFGGEFISAAEELAEWMKSALPEGIPNIAVRSRKQMKDVEFVATLLLLLESGVETTSQVDLDVAFSDRDTTWENRDDVVSQFKQTIDRLNRLLRGPRERDWKKSRFRNQLDFYSLFSAVAEAEFDPANCDQVVQQLLNFADAVDDEERRKDDPSAREYFEATRYASTNAAQRKIRKRILVGLLQPSLAVMT